MSEILQNKLKEAWQLFEDRQLDKARAIYLDCLDRTDKGNSKGYHSILMGLTYVEAFAEQFDAAREYAVKLLELADNPDDKHVYLHQYGMVERMAENYPKALEIFEEEAELIASAFPDDYRKPAANLYEQGYILCQCKEYDKAKAIMEKAISYAEKSGDYIAIGCNHRGLGELYALQFDTDNAIAHFEKAVDAFNKDGSDYGQRAIAELKQQASIFMIRDLTKILKKNKDMEANNQATEK